MSIRSFLMLFVLAVVIFAAILMNIILFESIRKIGLLKFEGRIVTAEAVQDVGERIKLRYVVNGIGYEIQEDKGSIEDLLSIQSNKIELIYSEKYPDGAITMRTFKRLDSFFILFISGFVIFTYAILVFVKKVVSVYRLFKCET